jgi:hypothetical protein
MPRRRRRPDAPAAGEPPAAPWAEDRRRGPAEPPHAAPAPKSAGQDSGRRGRGGATDRQDQRRGRGRGGKHEERGEEAYTVVDVRGRGGRGERATGPPRDGVRPGLLDAGTLSYFAHVETMLDEERFTDEDGARRGARTTA